MKNIFIQKKSYIKDNKIYKTVYETVYKTISSLLVLLLLQFGCTQKHAQTELHIVHPDRQAAAQINKSFILTDSESTNENPVLKSETSGSKGVIIKKAALNKAFLLSPTIIQTSSYPLIDHLAPKVVSFEKQGDQLAMIELNTLEVYNNFPTGHLLETFKILEETEQSVKFDWNYSLSAIPLENLFTTGGSDFITPIDKTFLNVLSVNKSFLREAKFVNNELQIEQLSEAVLNVIPPVATTVVLKFYLKPYIPNPNFKAKLSEFNKGIGSFEVVSVRNGDGINDFYSTLWDMSTDKGPITYAITSGVPEDYVDAIKEGILYWNKVAGREIVKVVTDADPNQFQPERTVLVNWVDFKQAGFARAGLQADPLTGEMLRADVYLTSAFAEVGSAVRSELQKLETLNKLTPNKKYKDNLKSWYVVQPTNFKTLMGCQTDADLFNQFKNELALSTDDPSTIKRVAQDYLREVTAHEVGHTLGMRHNFAGSTFSDLHSRQDIYQLNRSYIKNQFDTNTRITSTVMDYIFGLAEGAIGQSIKTKVFEYDKKFIQWGYLDGVDFDKEQVPAFCSDSKAYLARSVGCEVGDLGTNPMESYVYQFEKNIERAKSFISNYAVNRLYPKDPNDKLSKKEIIENLSKLDLDKLSESLVDPLKNINRLMTDDGRYFQIDQKIGSQGWLNESEYQSEYLAKWNEDLSAIGGLKKLIEILVPPVNDYEPVKSGWFLDSIMSFFNREDFKKGKTIEGVTYELTPDENEWIGQVLKSYGEKFEVAWLKAVLKQFLFKKNSDGADVLIAILGGNQATIEVTPVLRNGFSADDWWPTLDKIAQKIVLATNSDPIKITVDGSSLEVLEPKYPLELRQKVLDMMVSENYGVYPLTKEGIDKFKKESLLKFKEIFSREFDSSAKVKEVLKTTKLDGEAKKWISNELSLLEQVEKK